MVNDTKYNSRSIVRFLHPDIGELEDMAAVMAFPVFLTMKINIDMQYTKERKRYPARRDVVHSPNHHRLV